MRKISEAPPAAYSGIVAAAASVAGMVPVALASAATYFVWWLNFRYACAPAVLSHWALIAHCQEPPPIFGPWPRSTGGMTSASSPNAFVTVASAQLPE
ncbi:MAG: hypothetical protein BGO38_11050 [Cellulomonas sp. 73-145]|nr:hypothetical protein [Cellulomonas sp. 73-145]OJV56702.1 MAG: hypothetical protein BGO38_11050 [Cellulomonas sp. 73-145]